MRTDVHDYPHLLELVSKKILSSSLDKNVKDDIFAFQEECVMQGISTGRVTRYLYDVRKLQQWHGHSLRNASLDDIKHLVVKIEQSGLAPATKRDLKITLRKYVRFLQGTTDVPATVSWVKPSVGVKTMKIPEEVLTPEEVTRLVAAADNIRDRAFIAALYESGCRIGEILTLRIKHLAPANPGMQIRVDGKTGPRRVLLISSAPYLSELLNMHPSRDRGEELLWLTLSGKKMRYSTVIGLLRRLSHKAGIRKHLYPHLFRHSRATHLANHLTEAQMKEYFGWVQASEMAGVYVHMSGRDVDQAILRLNGLKPSEPKTGSVLAPLSCSRCKSSNPATHKFCMICGTPLTEQAATDLVTTELERKEADSILDRLLQDAEFKEMLDKKVRSLRD